MVVATRNTARRGWLDAAPNTPTTPVVKPSRHSKGKKRKDQRNQTTAAAPTATRPVVPPPIIAPPQKTSSVRFDLSSSQNSAFTAVEPRKSLEELPKLEMPVANNDPQEVGLTTPPTQKARFSAERFSMSTEQNTGNRKQRPLRSGPVDVDEVSISSTFSSVELEEKEEVTKAHTKVPMDQMQTKFQTNQEAADNKVIQRRASLEDEPGSPTASSFRSKCNNWLVTEREPFQRPGMTSSPPMSTRYLLASGKTLPEFSFTPYEEMRTHEEKTLSHESAPFSPPLSPAQLEESTVVPNLRARSRSPAACSDATLGFSDPTSPPLSPFDLDDVPPKESRRMSANTSPNSSLFKVNCSRQMLVSALSLPRHSTATTNADTTIDSTEHGSGEGAKEESAIVMSASHDDNLSFYNEDGDGGGTETPVPVPPPSSPPPLWRSTATSTQWIQNEKEPFQLQEMMMEEPMSPPISSSNLITQTRHGESKDLSVVLSPPTSPKVTFELAETLWEELNKYQTRKRENEWEDRKHQKKLNRKKEIYQQLHHAQQVVRLILKGSHFGDKDIGSPQACYEAIRQYAQLRVETSKLARQLEESKIQLRDRYLEWKELRKEMQTVPKNVAVEPNINHDSLALLQQLMSYDDSIYKEDDATIASRDHSNASRNMAKCDSFSVATKVDQEKDTGKAIAALFHEMQSELAFIRSAWQAQCQRLQDAPEKREPDQPSTSTKPRQAEDGTSNPLEEDNDSFLLAKIEELTAQIEDMERDREILSGFMDQLAEEVIRTENTNGFIQDPEIDMCPKDHDQMPNNWATFGARFPIHRLPMSALKEIEGGGTPSDCENENISKNLGAHDKEDENESERQEDNSTPFNVPPCEYKPSGLLLRSKRFQRPTDSFDLLPIHLPKSRGVSFERGELKQTLSDFSEDETRIEIVKLLQQPSLGLSSRDESEQSIGILTKNRKSVSFDSYFLRHQPSEPTSVAGRKLYSAFLRRKSTTSDRKGEQETSVLLEHDSIIGGLEEETYEKFFVDPYSSPSPSLQADQQPLGLDSDLVQKLKSPVLALELSMPPKILSKTDKDTSETTSRSSSLQGEDETSDSEGQVQLQTQQQERSTAEAKLALLRKEKSHLLLGFSEAAGPITTDLSQAVNNEDKHDKDSVSHGCDDQSALNEKGPRETILNTELTMSQEALHAMGKGFEDSESIKKTSMTSAVEAKLLQKAEECERLTCQVKSLADQLEIQMSLVADLERQLAARKGDAISSGRSRGEQDQEIDHLKSERDDYRAQVLQLSQQLAVRSLQINELESRTTKDVSCQSSNSSINSGSVDTPNEIDDGSSRSQDIPSSMPANTRSSPKRSPGRATAGMIRNLFTKKRFSLTSIKQGKNLPYAPMSDDSRQEANVTTTKGTAEDGSDTLLGQGQEEEEEDSQSKASKSGSSVATSSAAVSYVQLQTKTSMDISSREDAQLATIHSLMKKIEELEDENARLRSAS